MLKHYEDLRSAVLGKGKLLNTPVGLTIFLSKGMVGWIKAWEQIKAIEIDSLNKPKPLDKVELPEVMQSDLTIILADMVWHIKEKIYENNRR